MAFDFAIVSAFTSLYAFEPGTPTRQLLFLAIVVGAVRFGMRGGITIALAAFRSPRSSSSSAPHWFHVGYRVEYVTFQAGAGVLMALLVGWLVSRLDEQRRPRSSGPRRPRRCATSSGGAPTCSRPRTAARGRSARRSTSTRRSARSSASCAALVPFDRMAIVLAEDGTARVIATAGEQAGRCDAARHGVQLERNLLAEVVARARPSTARTWRSRVRRGGAAGRARPPLSGRRATARRRAGDRPDLAQPPRAERVPASTRSSSSACSAGSPHPPSRTSAPTRASAARSRSCGACRRCAPTSSRSSRTSCAARWRP